MKQYIKTLFIGLVCLFASLTAQAEVVTTYCDYDVFHLRCEYNSETDNYVIYLYDYDDSFIKNTMVFTETLTVEFLNYNGKGDDLTGELPYQLDCSIDFSNSDVRNTVESISILCHGTIPDYFAGYTMMDSHSDPTHLKKILIGDQITEIGEEAFAYHWNLETVECISGVSKIGNRAFISAIEEDMMMPGDYTYYSNLTSIGNLLKGASEIGEEAFCGHGNLTSLALTDGTFEKIGRDAFRNCGIRELTLHSNAGSAGSLTSSPFMGCPLSKVTIVDCYDNVAEVNRIIVNPYMFAGVTSPFDFTFESTTPDAPFEVVAFYDHCFSNSGVQSITLPEKYMLSFIYPYAVYFGESSFAYTQYLKTIDLSKVFANNVEIDKQAFYYSKLQTLTLPEAELSKVGNSAFKGSSLTGDFVIPAHLNPSTKSVESVQVNSEAFAYTSTLNSVTFQCDINDDGTEHKLASRMFYNSSVKAVTLPSSIEEIGEQAFNGSALTSFTGSSSLTTINKEAFRDCRSLTSVDLSGTGVKTLAYGLFRYCDKLEELLLPSEMNLYESYCFDGTALKSLEVNAEEVGADALFNMPKLEEIRFVNKNLSTLKENTLTSLPSLKTVDFGEYVSRLEAHFISDCPQFENVVISQAMEVIDKNAFENVATQIQSITLASNNMSDIEDNSNAPFRGYTVGVYFAPAVTKVPKNLFADVYITNSMELRKDLNIDKDAFKDANIDSLDWHFADVDVYPFKSALVEKLTFSKITDITYDHLFAEAPITNLYLEGLTAISGKGAFEHADIANYDRASTLIIPATMTTIAEDAFKDINTDNLLFEKGTGLTIGANAFKRSSDAYLQITTFYTKENIPAADKTSFAFDDKIETFFAGGCEDKAAYQAAEGWKEISAEKWDGVTEYKYGFEIVGEQTARPVEYYYDYININDIAPSMTYIGCSNTAKISFYSPCSGIVFDHWADGTKDYTKYDLTLTSDTIIRIYVKETQQDLKLALSDEKLSDAATIYMSLSGEEKWVEQSSAKVNDCDYAIYDAKVVLNDPDHYYFTRWYNAKDMTTYNDNSVITYLQEALDLRAEVKVVTYDLMVGIDPTCMGCDEMLDKFIITADKSTEETSSYYKSIPYNTPVTVEFVGQKSSDNRYILEYWADETGNYVSDENPYTFAIADNQTLYPVIKPAGAYSITAKAVDDALGNVTMTPEAGAETSAGSGKYWEGSKIDLTADAIASHTYFDKWNDGDPNPYRTVTVNKPYDYVALFKKDSFDITVKVEGIDPALVTVAGTGRYAWHDEVSLSYTLSDDHYTFSDWFGKEIYSDKNVFSFEVESSVEVRLVFTPNNYKVTVVAEPAEGGTVKGNGDAPYKAIVILDAIPNEGYYFVAWQDDDKAPAKREVEILGDVTYTAIFSAIDYSPTGLTVNRETIGEDERITLSWTAVAGADSYEIMVKSGETVIASGNTMGTTTISQLLSDIQSEYKLPNGTYTIDWAVRSTNGEGTPISGWVSGDSFDITLKNMPTAVDNVENDVHAQKVIINGVLYIRKGDKLFNALGKQIR